MASPSRIFVNKHSQWDVRVCLIGRLGVGGMANKAGKAARPVILLKKYEQNV